jgi:hypothetical protein
MNSGYYRFSTSGENQAHGVSKKGGVTRPPPLGKKSSKGERQWQSANVDIVETLLKLLTYMVTPARHFATTMSREQNLAPLLQNNNGGYYQPGCRYAFVQRWR